MDIIIGILVAVLGTTLTASIGYWLNGISGATVACLVAMILCNIFVALIRLR